MLLSRIGPGKSPNGNAHLQQTAKRGTSSAVWRQVQHVLCQTSLSAAFFGDYHLVNEVTLAIEAECDPDIPRYIAL